MFRKRVFSRILEFIRNLLVSHSKYKPFTPGNHLLQENEHVFLWNHAYFQEDGIKIFYIPDTWIHSLQILPIWLSVINQFEYLFWNLHHEFSYSCKLDSNIFIFALLCELCRVLLFCEFIGQVFKIALCGMNMGKLCWNTGKRMWQSMWQGEEPVNIRVSDSDIIRSVARMTFIRIPSRIL